MELSAAEYLRHLDALDADGLRRVLVYELLQGLIHPRRKAGAGCLGCPFYPIGRWILCSPGGELVSAVTISDTGRHVSALWL